MPEDGNDAAGARPRQRPARLSGVDPAAFRSVEDYKAALRRITTDTGVAYRQIAKGADIAPATLSDLLSPRKNLPREYGNVGKVVRFCCTVADPPLAPDEADRVGQDWKQAWTRIKSTWVEAAAGAEETVEGLETGQARGAGQAGQVASGPSVSSRPWRRRPLAAGVVVVALLGAAGVWRGASGRWPFTGSGNGSTSQAGELSNRQWYQPDASGAKGECIGFSDGTDTRPFGVTDPAADKLMSTLGAQNSAAESRSRLYPVDVVLVLALTQAGTSCSSPTGAVSALAMAELEAAAMVVHESLQYEQAPPLRIVIANAGYDLTDADVIAEQLKGLSAQNGGHLGAVVGLGQSRPKTLAAEDILEAAGIPMSISTASQDTITQTGNHGGMFTNLVRSAPTDYRETALLAQAMQQHKVMNPCMIEDDDKEYPFFSDWAADFSQVWQMTGSGAAPGRSPYDTSDSSGPGDLDDKPGDCRNPAGRGGTPYDAVVYDGASGDLNYVLNKLKRWGWPTTTPVFADDDVSQLFSSTPPAGDAWGQGWKVYIASYGFAGLKDGSSYDFPAIPGYTPPTSTSGSPFDDSYTWLQQQLPGLPAGAAGLSPVAVWGNLYIDFDADWAAAQAVKQTGGDVLAHGGQAMRTRISQQLHGMCGSHAITGPTGVLSFDRQGDAMHQLILVIELDAKGAETGNQTGMKWTAMSGSSHVGDLVYNGTADNSSCPPTPAAAPGN